MCLCCYCWCLCGGVLLGVLLSVWMQWLLSIDMMDMLTDLCCACSLRVEWQSSILLLGVIPRPYWIDCCCWRVNVVVHVHVPVHSGSWLLILIPIMVTHPCGWLPIRVMWIVLKFFLSTEPILTINGDTVDILQSVISLTSCQIVIVRVMHHPLILQRNVATQLLFPWWQKHQNVSKGFIS